MRAHFFLIYKFATRRLKINQSMTDTRPVNSDCPYCGSTMVVSKMTCGHCQVAVEADFPMSRLSTLPVEHQKFIEMFVLAGGNLKEIAEEVGVFYQTMRA